MRVIPPAAPPDVIPPAAPPAVKPPAAPPPVMPPDMEPPAPHPPVALPPAVVPPSTRAHKSATHTNPAGHSGNDGPHLSAMGCGQAVAINIARTPTCIMSGRTAGVEREAGIASIASRPLPLWPRRVGRQLWRVDDDGCNSSVTRDDVQRAGPCRASTCGRPAAVQGWRTKQRRARPREHSSSPQRSRYAIACECLC